MANNEQQLIRNFCIIAHIDHGKSTLADRLLELTGTVSKREMKDQFLDQMDLERERGITIKLAPVQMLYQSYVLNLIDTPGHVDFSYEVSRSLACCEGAILLVDATQGIQAQTVAHLHVAQSLHLQIIPVINKIDLQNAEVAKTRQELATLLKVAEESVMLVSAKTGQGVEALLQEVIKRVPSPRGDNDASLQSLVFDSAFDDYKGVIAYTRVMNGRVAAGDKIQMMATGKESDVLDVGVFKPKLSSREELGSGAIGYVVTGLKNIQDLRVGDTMTNAGKPTSRPIPGYKRIEPMVFAGIYCMSGDDFPKLRQAMERLQLNDSSLVYEPDSSQAFGFGFRCGFLGLLHVEIVQERLTREYGLSVILTVPSVAYKIVLNEQGRRSLQKRKKLSPEKMPDALFISNPHELPETSQIERIEEPWVNAEIISPSTSVGQILNVIQERRGIYRTTEYLNPDRLLVRAELPLASIIVDFYDTMKSVTSGYASLHYEFFEYRLTQVVRLDILVADELVPELSTIVYEENAQRSGRKICERLKNILPRQQFEVKIQALIGGKIIASARISPMRKDVTAPLYGGDVTRKKKLLEKQKKGKKRMRLFGKVTIPQEAYLAVLKERG